MGGKRALPTALKQLKDTHQPCRDAPNAPPANIGTMPAPPDWLSERAARYFREFAAMLQGMRVLSLEDTAALTLLASRMDEVEEHTATIEDEGYSYRAENGLWKARPEVAMRNEAMRHAQSLLIEFGLTPAARSRVSAHLGDKPENPFLMLEREVG